MSERYVFGEFVLSSSRRVLHRSGREIGLVPRYFDLLLLLIRRRHEAISRSEILDSVWSDVVVSDGALSQAVRTLRRALGDDPAQSKYIRTVSRFGYQFVFPDVVQGDDTGPLPSAGPSPAGAAATASDFDSVFGELASEAPETERRLAAEALHRLGTKKAVARLRDAARGPEARALLRDARWDMPQAGSVPIFGQPRPLRTLWELFLLRLRGVRHAAGKRYAAAVAGAAAAGFLAGAAGGLALYLGPASPATGAVFVLLPLIGGLIGAVGAAGVAAGLCCAEVLIRSYRGAALVVFAAAGGGAVGAAGHGLGSIVLQAIFGQDLSPIAGGLEGVVIGAATGLGYALAVPLPGGGMASPRGAARARAVLAAGVACAVATAILTARGSYLGAMSLDLLAQRFPGSQVSLAPLARLLGEPAPGPVTRIAIGAWEGMMFASGTLFGLTHRPQ